METFDFDLDYNQVMMERLIYAIAIGILLGYGALFLVVCGAFFLYDSCTKYGMATSTTKTSIAVVVTAIVLAGTYYKKHANTNDEDRNRSSPVGSNPRCIPTMDWVSAAFTTAKYCMVASFHMFLTWTSNVPTIRAGGSSVQFTKEYCAEKLNNEYVKPYKFVSTKVYSNCILFH
jgi:hypothetical protein